MDYSSITSVPELCAALQIPSCDLLLPCIVCGNFLIPEDIQNFSAAPFCIVWRSNCAYGICESCAKLTAAFERLNYTQGSFSADDYLLCFGEAVFAVTVRCLRCLHKLSVSEIDCMVEAGQHFVLVRDILRGLCSSCNLE